MRFLVLFILLLSNSIFANETTAIDLLENTLGQRITDYKTRTYHSTNEDCSISTSLSTFESRLTVNVRNKHREETFFTASHMKCSYKQFGSDILIECAGDYCETQGCVREESSIIISKRKITVGKVSCRL